MARKVMYDYVFKERVKFVLENHYSYEFVSNLKEIEKFNIHKWVGFYKQYGKNELIP